MPAGDEIPDPVQVAAESSKRLEAAGVFTPLRILQRAVLETAIGHDRDNGGPWQSERDFARCRFCGEDAIVAWNGNDELCENFSKAAKKIRHLPDCAYLVALALPPLESPPIPKFRHIEFEEQG